MATPYHTVIRLAKKMIELGCYCDLKTEISLLSTYIDMVASFGCSNRHNVMYSRFFGTKYHNDFNKYREILESYCKVYCGSPQLTLPNIGLPKQNYYEMALTVPSFHQELKLLFSKFGLRFNSFSLLKIYDRLCRPSTRSSIKTRFQIAMTGSGHSTVCALQNRKFLACDFDINCMQNVI